jgi:hypothetical protein
MLYTMSTSPMAKVGRSAAAEVRRRREFFNMLIKSVRVVRVNLTIMIRKTQKFLSRIVIECPGNIFDVRNNN